jgi:hypothetical protein
MVSLNLPGYKERAAILGIGLLGNAIIANGFDYVLYPWVIWKLGPFQGAAMMTLLSFLICWVTLRFYDWAKKDWLGIETLKELRNYHGANVFARTLRWAMAKGDAVLLVILSVWADPFVAVAYLRHGAHQYNGMTARDWRIFMLALVIGNAYWSVVMFAGVSAVEYAWSAISESLP